MQNKKVLIDKFLNRTISQIERRELEKWVLRHPDNASYFKECIKRHSGSNKEVSFDADKAFDKFLINVENKRKTTKILPQNLLRYAAVLAGLIVASYFILQNLNTSAIDNTSFANKDKIENKAEIEIILADGSKRTISSENSSSVVDVNGNVIASGSMGTLNFSNVENETSDELAFNEIHIPYGEKLKIVLSDKTEVWLNSGSTFKFPQNLNASSLDKRLVYLNGEAFFDVTKNVKKPFIVKTNEIDIRVLGTQFNVSAYNQDEDITTTLVEGSVNIYETERQESPMILSPEDQALFKKTNSSFKKRKVDTDIYTSWMQNRLVIDNLSFEQIITKLERSHNVTITNQVPELNQEIFKGEFKNENIDEILKTISLSKPFKYEINQNTITITK